MDKKKRVTLTQMCAAYTLRLFVFIGEKDEQGRNCLGYFRVAQQRTQGMMAEIWLDYHAKHTCNELCSAI